MVVPITVGMVMMVMMVVMPMMVVHTVDHEELATVKTDGGLLDVGHMPSELVGVSLGAEATDDAIFKEARDDDRALAGSESTVESLGAKHVGAMELSLQLGLFQTGSMVDLLKQLLLSQGSSIF